MTGCEGYERKSKDNYKILTWRTQCIKESYIQRGRGYRYRNKYENKDDAFSLKELNL